MKRTALALVASMMLAASPAFAGPPLLCFPYEIGQAQSLPWGSDAFQKDKKYEVANVEADTLALLAAEKSALVRMETIRRAALYIGKDNERASNLVLKLLATAKDAEAAGKPDAAGWFNAGFALATLNQNGCHLKGLGSSGKDPVGYAEIKKALEITPDDAAMQFGAALVAFEHDRSAMKKHMQKALALVEPGSPLARSMETNHALGAKSLKQLKSEYAVSDASKK